MPDGDMEALASLADSHENGTAEAILQVQPQDGDGAADAAWVPKSAAARILGVSQTTVRRMGESGKLAARVREDGVRVFKISGSAARAMVQAKQTATASLHSVDAAKAIAAGESVEALCVRGIPPAVIAKTLRDYRAAMVELRAIQADQRAAEDAAMLRESAAGSPMVPSTFAWLCTKLNTMPHAEALAIFDAWRAEGGNLAIVSPLVSRALTSADAWREAGARWAFVRTQEEERVAAERLRRELADRKAIAKTDHEVQRIERTDAEIEAIVARIDAVRETTRTRRKTEERTAARVQEEKLKPREGISAQPHIEAEAPRKTKKPPGSFQARMRELEERRQAAGDEDDDGSALPDSNRR